MGLRVLFDEFDPAPPLHDWGVQFGAVAHQYRVILDNAVEELARAEGLPKSYSRHFPIATTKPLWEKEQSRLKGFPDRVIEVLYGMQPFVHHRGASDPNDHVLAVLAWTDNSDKHDDILVFDFLADQFDVGAVVDLDDPGVKLNEVSRVSRHLDFKPGRALLSVRTDPHLVVKVERADIWLTVVPSALDHAGNWTPLPDAFNEFLTMTLHSLLTLSLVWSDPAVDTRKFAGSSDRLPGVAFGKAAIDSRCGDGVWDSDHRHSDSYLSWNTRGHTSRALARLQRLGELPRSFNSK